MPRWRKARRILQPGGFVVDTAEQPMARLEAMLAADSEAVVAKKRLPRKLAVKVRHKSLV